MCRPTGDKWQSKTLFLLIFDMRSLIVDYVFDCHLPGVIIQKGKICTLTTHIVISVYGFLEETML